ncbi:MAG TPA: MFS transporter [Steroidobacteraceae bacterium]|jgi:AAHS family 4-hydroxybenzoate transporter-like MFS transporter
MMSPPKIVDVSALINGRRLGAFNYRLIVLSWLITAFDGFDMMVIGFTLPYMHDQLGLSKVQGGIVVSSGLVGMMLGGFLLSYLGDRAGRRPTLIGAALAFGVLTAAISLAGSYHALLALRFIDGLALGGMLPLAWALNIEFVPSSMRSTVVTVIMMGYSVGTAIAGPMTNWIAPTHGWQGVYLAGGIGSLVCAAGLWLVLPESVRFLAAKGQRPELLYRTLKSLDPVLEISPTDRFVVADEIATERGFRPAQLFRGDLRAITPLLWLGYFCSSLAIYFVASWGPTLVEELHFPRQTAALVASAGSLLGAVAGLLLMRFTDRRGAGCVAFYPALAVPVLLVMGFGLVPHAVFLPFAILSVVLISGGHFGILSLAGVYYPSSIRASGAGWATSVAKFGAILGPILGGLVLSSGSVLHSYAQLALFPAILCACALGMGAMLRRRTAPVPAAALASALSVSGEPP